jgi:hypothetical protein
MYVFMYRAVLSYTAGPDKTGALFCNPNGIISHRGKTILDNASTLDGNFLVSKDMKCALV